MQAEITIYCAELEAILAELPAPRRAEFVAEAHAHLQAMVAARRADGLGETAAWNAVLSEFGAAPEVGRALREQWASSGQLECEGAPLSKRQLIGKMAPPLLVALGFYLLLLSVPHESWESAWAGPLYALLTLGVGGFGLWRARRLGMKWTPATIANCAFCVLMMLNAIVLVGWGDALNSSQWSDKYPWAMLCVVALFALISRALRGRERGARPWRVAANTASNPVAAEQEFRLYPRLSFALGAAMMGCGLVVIGVQQTFGFPLALLTCASILGGAAAWLRWLRK